ncbi:RNA polymerase sigma-54 factor RpoN [Lysobacter dokdonensis DS-58]|uniref:RNA polymerase sigma factor n=1 Tax=Lysobacter dokdonensis DS-58 TaxID=1300345 RepID=A0A0A2WHU4_9GAMM|nr:RNA polymerase sigma factor [Lysobacter dokdonensis]KGQ18277.1 RNA polymerase sigma-54 factor RpoN [Lysobacter dokdonensis DS-58]
MVPQDHRPLVDFATLDDATLVALARAGRREAFRQIMQRCNRRLFRVARGVVHDDHEAEDIVQASYVSAFEHLAGFRGEASLTTWLTRIVLNEANGRLRARKPTVGFDAIEAMQQETGRVIAFPGRFGSEDPAAGAARSEIRRLLEHAVDELPEPFRLVFVLREIEECTVEDTAVSLGIKPETVKTRLHRARRLLRAALHDKLATTMTDAFPFLGARCDRMTNTVLDRIAHRLRD